MSKITPNALKKNNNKKIKSLMLIRPQIKKFNSAALCGH
jgi:hypothetical protein